MADAAVAEPEDYSSLAQLRDYECPECGELDGMAYTESEAEAILGGDDHGFVRCAECGEELEPTVEAAIAMLEMVERRMGTQTSETIGG